ncbi:hypothetical protein ACQP1V_43005 (plasmid) [Microtetraspora malaysiensis]|uniref:hypothetical protein n=1 Tax=Microtetraspora malaysiensis TaxID=161358 RepID=UPI003D8ED3A0
MPKTPDWDSPHIRSINPAARDRVGWYDSTPGLAPSYRGRKIPIGTVVQVVDPLFIRTKGWSGRIVEHMMDSDGTYTGLSIAECLDTGGQLNKRVGRADQVEIVHCTVIDGGNS